MKRVTTAVVLLAVLGAGVAGSAGGGALAYRRGVQDGVMAERLGEGPGVPADPRKQMLRSDTELNPGKEATVLPGQKLLDGWTVAVKPGKVTDCCGTVDSYVASVSGQIRNDNPGPVSSDAFLLQFVLSGDDSRAGWVICDTPRQTAGQTSTISCKSVVSVDPNYDRIELGDPNE